MEIREVLEKKEWDKFFLKTEKIGGEFLQSWDWGNFQKSLGRKILRLRIEQNKKAIGQALIVKHNLPFGKSYFYCPRGPILLSVFEKEQYLNFLLEYLKRIAKKERAIFFRLDLRKESLKSRNLKKVFDLQPSHTIILDLKKDVEDILRKMHSKTRYNIRLAKRHKVKIFFGKKEKEIKEFLNLIHKTSKREKFNIYSDEYYRKLLSFSFTDLCLSEYKGNILTAHLLICFQGVTTYLHGGSSRIEKSVMAPYLTHCEAIKKSRQNGCNFYDFWGINQKKWPGLTKFKKNFGGKEIFYPGTFDFVFSKFWANIYYFIKLCFRFF